jgi:hypothetical protein
MCIFSRSECKAFKGWYKDLQYSAVKILTVDAIGRHERNELEYLKAEVRNLGHDGHGPTAICPYYMIASKSRGYTASICVLP